MRVWRGIDASSHVLCKRALRVLRRFIWALEKTTENSDRLYMDKDDRGLTKEDREGEEGKIM